MAKPKKTVFAMRIERETTWQIAMLMKYTFLLLGLPLIALGGCQLYTCRKANPDRTVIECLRGQQP